MKKIDLKKEKENFKYNSFYNSLIEGGKEVLDLCEISDTFKKFLREGFLENKAFELVNCEDTKKINLLSGEIFSYLDSRIKYRNLVIVLDMIERDDIDLTNKKFDLESPRKYRPRYLAEVSFDDKPMKFIVKLENPFIGIFDTGRGYEFEILKKTSLDIQSEIYYSFIEELWSGTPYRYILANKDIDINLKELEKYKSLNAVENIGSSNIEHILSENESWHLYLFQKNNFTLPNQNFVIEKKDIDHFLKSLNDSSEIFFSENLTFKSNSIKK